MTQQVLTALGGLGLFLLGMVVMTEGLRGMAGAALQAWLTRFTRSPSSGALTGTVATAILQSSSATTVTTVGFVAAGLMTFPQALGIIFGANVGTTVTGWMVALVGFKLKLGATALPVVFAGMMLNLFGRGRWKQLGRTLAGFGLVFLGIDFMQGGMSGFEGRLTPDQFPPDTLGGRLLLVALGALVTVVTQSSSAGVAIAMTALSVGAMNFAQAAALVIGMDVGTTVTAVLAALGSSEAARRTGFSHTIYNLFTALAALLILGPYLWFIEAAWPGSTGTSPELTLVGFHTLFNVLAMLLGLPLAGQFARLMEWLVPDRDDGLARRLDDRLLSEPAAAAAAMDATLREEFAWLLERLLAALAGERGPVAGRGVEQVYQDFLDTRDYLDRMNAVPEGNGPQLPVITGMHVLDHLHRMHWRLQQDERIQALQGDKLLAPLARELHDVAQQVLDSLPGAISEAVCARAEALVRQLVEQDETDRVRAIEQAALLDHSAAQTGRWLESRRWLSRMAHHVWRAAAHLGGFAAGDRRPD